MRRREAFEPSGEMRKVTVLCLFSGSQGDEEGEDAIEKSVCVRFVYDGPDRIDRCGPNGQRRRILHSVLRLGPRPGTVVFHLCILIFIVASFSKMNKFQALGAFLAGITAFALFFEGSILPLFR